MVQNIYN